MSVTNVASVTATLQCFNKFNFWCGRTYEWHVRIGVTHGRGDRSWESIMVLPQESKATAEDLIESIHAQATKPDAITDAQRRLKDLCAEANQCYACFMHEHTQQLVGGECPICD